MTLEAFQFKINPVYEKLIPRLDPVIYQELKNAIKKFGFKGKIFVNQHGVVLDGHNRIKICQELGINLGFDDFAVFPFEDPLEEKKFVITVTLNERHLNEFQKIELGYELHKIEKEKSRLRQLSQLKNVKVSLAPIGANEKVAAEAKIKKGKTSKIIADSIGVKVRTYERGIKVIEKGTEEQKEKCRRDPSAVFEESNKIIRDEREEKKESENPPVGELPPEIRRVLFNEDSTKQDRKKLPSRMHSIITDPPYGKQYLYLYEWLAEFANRELQEGDSLIFLCGHIILDDVFAIFRKYKPSLNFYWMLDLDHEGPGAPVWSRKFFPGWKPILYYVKGKEPAHQIKRVSDKIKSKKPNKITFEWTQSLIEFEFMVENFTVENQTVFDPFLGEEGNTAIACYKHNRRFAGNEIDKERFDKSVKKINEFIHEMKNNKNETAVATIKTAKGEEK